MRQVTGLRFGLLITAMSGFCVAYAAPSQAPAADPSTGSQPQTVWSGVYTEAQAFRGEKVADTLCIGCHGSNLDGGDSGPRLVGPVFLENWSSQSAGELFSWLQEAMPADSPGTLSKPDTAAVMAYILKLNKMPAGKEELPTTADALSRIKILASR